MSIFLPFNFNPSSVSVKTGSYTIPSGFYAHVVVDTQAGGTFTIDGNAAITVPSEAFNTIATVDISQNSLGNTDYTVPTGYIFEGNGHCTGADSSITVGGVTAITHVDSGSTSSSGPIRAGQGQVISCISSSGTATASVSGYAKKDPQGYNNITSSFWVPSGTVLNETSTVSYTVSLFAIP